MRASKRASSLPVNPQRVLIAKADELARRGVKVYNYTAGQPGLPPDTTALEYFIEMTRRDPFKHFKYVPTQGLLELRTAISEDLKKYGGIEVQPKDILITAGGSDGLVISLITLLDEGDTLLLLDPSYSVYWDLARLLGLKVETCKQSFETGFNPDPECIKSKLGSKAKAILFASPDNPTSRIISREVAETIIDVAYEKKAWVIYDVAYKHIVYEGEHVWLEKLAPSMDYLVVVGSFSKDLAIPGGRLGYVYGPSDIVAEMVKLKGVLGIVAPVPMQWLAYYYLTLGIKDKYLREVLPVYRRRRDAAYEAFARSLPMAKLHKPIASMYLFPDISYYMKRKGVSSDVEFTLKLVEEKAVAMLPGSIFGEAGRNHLRVTFVTMSESDLAEGIKLLAEFVGES
ncbi:MAG: pyridoxal phosphate-dependent aminotransferase [Desulfurococcus sp.]|nr:pyridoxal phosphate-dependent aminotransferase [Desulfurococcus sp.]